MQLRLLNRIATVKDDGTVEFEVPGDVEPQSLQGGSNHTHTKVVDDEPLDEADPQYIPPLQVVMLIVGTRGDVQPFIAIGKRLQVTVKIIMMESEEIFMFFSFHVTQVSNEGNSILFLCRTMAIVLG